MRKLLCKMTGSGLGLWLATLFVVGVKVQTYPDSSFFGISLSENWKFFVFFGIILGLLSYFVKPVLNAITLPLRIITLGLVGFLVNMFLVWVMDIIFKEVSIPLFLPILYTTLIIWGLNIVLKMLFTRKD